MDVRARAGIREIQADRRCDIAVRVPHRSGDAVALSRLVDVVAGPPVQPDPFEFEFQLAERRMSRVHNPGVPERSDLVAGTAGEQHLRGGAAVGRYGRARDRAGHSHSPHAVAPVDVDQAATVPRDQAHGASLPFGHLTHDRTSLSLQLTRAQEHRRQRDRAPSEPVAAVADALQQPNRGKAREHVMGQRLADFQPLRRRGHPPLGLLRREQVEHISGAFQRSEHSLTPQLQTHPA